MGSRDPESQIVGQPRQLTKMRPGSKCRLVDILGVGRSRHRWRMGRERHHDKENEILDPDCPFRKQRGESARGIMRRLMDLGITKGCTIVVVQTGGHGPTLVEVRGTRIALGQKLACRILVEEVA
ncbi:MAG: ferrous iron transport protein A [Promethearchaeota archaeon]